MHVLIVNNTRIPVLKYGGTERDIWHQGAALVKMGHQVSYSSWLQMTICRHMTEAYLQLFEKVMNGEALNPAPLRTLATEIPRILPYQDLV